VFQVSDFIDAISFREHKRVAAESIVSFITPPEITQFVTATQERREPHLHLTRDELKPGSPVARATGVGPI
jgi:hypothetical protein